MHNIKCRNIPNFFFMKKKVKTNGLSVSVHIDVIGQRHWKIVMGWIFRNCHFWGPANSPVAFLSKICSIIWCRMEWESTVSLPTVPQENAVQLTECLTFLHFLIKLGEILWRLKVGCRKWEDTNNHVFRCLSQYLYIHSFILNLSYSNRYCESSDIVIKQDS